MIEDILRRRYADPRWITEDMSLPEAEDALDYILEQEFKDRAYQAWLHSFSDLSFEKFLERCRPEKVRSSEEILAETDKLFEGR